MELREMSKILLIGESCKDIFIYGECERLNPEAPTPVFIPKSETDNDGMAGNVRNNIKALGFKCDFTTNDEKCLKKRFVDEQSNYILLRVDSDVNYKPININDLGNIESYDMVVISDYNKGLLSEDLIEEIGRRAKLSFIDTKKEIGSWIGTCTYIKINNREYLENKNFVDTVLRKKVIITMGKNGCRLNNDTIPGKQVEVRDVVGAGDTFLAALSVKYLETNDIYKSMMFANKCSAQVVRQRGVGLPNDK